MNKPSLQTLSINQPRSGVRIHDYATVRVGGGAERFGVMACRRGVDYH